MFSFANVVHLLSHKFAGLGGWCFALAFVSSRSFNRFLFGHMYLPLRLALQKNYNVLPPQLGCQNQTRMRKSNMYAFLDDFFFVFHTSWILFVLTRSEEHTSELQS